MSTCHLYNSCSEKKHSKNAYLKQNKDSSEQNICWCEHPCSPISKEFAKSSVQKNVLKCNGNLDQCEIDITNFLGIDQKQNDAVVI